MRKVTEADVRMGRIEVEDALNAVRGLSDTHVLLDREDYRRTLTSALLLGDVAAQGFANGQEVEAMKAVLGEQVDQSAQSTAEAITVNERLAVVIQEKDARIEELEGQNKELKEIAGKLYESLNELADDVQSISAPRGGSVPWSESLDLAVNVLRSTNPNDFTDPEDSPTQATGEGSV
jgi:ubiquinone biosynthesis protein UbiJ